MREERGVEGWRGVKKRTEEKEEVMAEEKREEVG